MQYISSNTYALDILKNNKSIKQAFNIVIRRKKSEFYFELKKYRNLTHQNYS